MYEDEVDKTNTGYPGIRILSNIIGEDSRKIEVSKEYPEWCKTFTLILDLLGGKILILIFSKVIDVDAGDFVRLTSNTSTTDMGTVPPSNYNIRIGNKKLFKDPLQLDLGGVFTFALMETDDGIYVSIAFQSVIF